MEEIFSMGARDTSCASSPGLSVASNCLELLTVSERGSQISFSDTLSLKKKSFFWPYSLDFGKRFSDTYEIIEILTLV